MIELIDPAKVTASNPFMSNPIKLNTICQAALEFEIRWQADQNTITYYPPLTFDTSTDPDELRIQTNDISSYASVRPPL